MKIIERLSEMIEEEICDAEKYIRCALKQKEEYPKLADLFAKLSNDEMGHMDLLHDAVTELIANYRRDHGEPPKDMLAVYQYLHQKAIDHAVDVKGMQEMYKR